MKTEDRIQNPALEGEQSTRGMSATPRILALALGDIVVFLIFAVIGMRSHKEAVTPLSVIEVAAPFVLGWFLVAPFLGAFKRGLEVQPRRMSLMTALSWLLACPVGLLLRWAFVQRIPEPTFALITFITNLIFLQLWRWPFAFFVSKRR